MVKDKDISLTEKSRKASVAVWKKLLKEHKKTGEPIVSWKDGRVAYLSPYDLTEVAHPSPHTIREDHAEYKKKDEE